MADLKAWAATVAGRYIDVDGWVGAQCWDLSQHWLTTCNGGTLWTQPSRFPGMAAGSWEVATQGSDQGRDLRKHVTAHPGTERGLPGDIIIWAHGAADYPISHTAVLIEDRGPILHTLSQNSSGARPDLPGYSVESSGPSIYQDLPRAGILGFLRPRATITGQANNITPIPSFTEMDIDLATPSAVVTALMNHPITLRDGTKADLQTHLVNLFGNVNNIPKKTDKFTDAKGEDAGRLIDIIANLGSDLRAVKTKTDKLK